MKIENIICFRHCVDNAIFSKQVPDTCPICFHKTDNFIQDPFEIPCLLSDAKNHPYSIVVRPTNGNFLIDYEVFDDLHIGLTNKVGEVIEYDHRGLLINESKSWEECLSIEVISESWKDHWDQILTDASRDSSWMADNYNTDSFNCFNFVFDFFKNLNYPQIQFNCKEAMCKAIILPKIQSIINYTKISRELQNNIFYIEN